MRRANCGGSNSNTKKLPATQKQNIDKDENKDDSETNVSADSKDAPEKPADNFEAELRWCIEKLKLLLSSTNSSQKQTDIRKKAISVLSDVKAPLIKKRSVMRTSLGDYRTQMKEDELRYLKESKNMKVISVAQSNQKGIYLKKCKDCTTKESDSNSGFKFDFPFSEMPTE
ncbi:hypothetical protein CHUAL_009072 [Chamberlinius hualienensis]